MADRRSSYVGRKKEEKPALHWHCLDMRHTQYRVLLNIKGRIAFPVWSTNWTSDNSRYYIIVQ